ncbi:MAG: hypothetical protein RL441_903 [Actinomycetota bacterium]|jgi:threonine/homoserine/homoserine lactone efflux protein
MTSALMQFAVVAGLMTLVPGLDFTMILRTALTQSKRVAFAAGAGICLGLFVWALAAAAGLSAVLAASESAFTALRLAGAAYMIYLGAMFIWHSRHPQVATESDAVSAESAITTFWRGVLTNILNPKIGAFYIAMLPPFIPADTNVALAGLALGAVHVIESMLYFTAIILAANFFKSQFSRPRFRAWLDRVAGVLIIGFGVRLLTASSPA